MADRGETCQVNTQSQLDPEGEWKERALRGGGGEEQNS